jgi:hypothetical protein
MSFVVPNRAKRTNRDEDGRMGLHKTTTLVSGPLVIGDAAVPETGTRMDKRSR